MLIVSRNDVFGAAAVGALLAYCCCCCPFLLDMLNVTDIEMY